MKICAITILSGIFCLCYSQVAPCAEIEVVDNNVFVETDTYQVQFTDGVITQIHNKLTEETYTLPLGVGGVTGFRGRSGLLSRTYAVDPFSCGLWFVVAQFIALSSGISPQFWHESQFCVSPVKEKHRIYLDRPSDANGSKENRTP